MVTAQAKAGSGVPACSSIIERLLRHAELDPDRDAIVTPDESVSYAELSRRVLAEAQRFREAGISEDSVVGIRCSDDVQHLLYCLATAYVGATSFAVPSYESARFQDLIARQCGATHIAGIDGLEPVLPDSPARSGTLHEARLLFFTSGTTGAPKIVLHHDSDIVAQAHRHVGSVEERFACLASIEHNFAKRHRLYCVAVGASNVFLDPNHELLVKQCQSLDVNVLHVSAFQAQELLAVPGIGELSGIRLKLGGSHVPLALRRQLRQQITDRLHAGYGTTETGAIAFTDPDDAHAGESVGRPLEGIEVRVVSADRQALEAGERGELAIRCEGMFRAYLDNPELTAARLRNGWFYTGDTGYLDSEQRIHLSGRSDDMFMFNSMNIYPQEIESQICRFPGVSEALVIPKLSAVHGNIPVAFVVFEKHVDPDVPALKAFVRKYAGARSPRQITVVESLPRNASGKISRREAQSLPEKSEQIRTALIGVLNADVIARLKPASIAAFIEGDSDIVLRGIGLDSYGRMEVMVMLEVEYGVVITPEEFGRFASLGDICDRVLSSPREVALSPPGSVEVSEAPAAQYTDDERYLLRFFRRVYRHCPTVAQLYRSLGTLEHRLTPLEFSFLQSEHLGGRLLPADAAEKYRTALSTWFERMQRQMLDSRKREPEPFVARRIRPTVSHFVGPGPAASKTLLVCFANKGSRLLMMPNAVLMQHTDAGCYDLLVIAEPRGESYRHGVPGLGETMGEVVEWLANLELIRSYEAVRTIGCSAGAFIAVIAAYRLGAELAVSVAGRFHSERYPIRIFERVISTWRAARNGQCSRVLMCYPADRNKTRDRLYARVMAKLTGGSLFGLEFSDGQVGHLVLRRLLERGELARYLDRTVFASCEDEVFAGDRANVVLSLPSGEIR